MAIKRPQWPIAGKALWLLIAAAILLAGGSFWVVRSLIQARQAEVAETAAPPPRQVQVAALGRVEPAGRVVEVVPADGGRLERLLVAEGDSVEPNQVLAYLDLYDVRLAERDLAASQLAEAQSLLDAQIAFGTASVQEAQTRIDQIDNPQAAAIQAQADTINSFQAQLRVAEVDLTRFQQLYQDGAIARQDLDQQQATVDQLRAQLASAQNRKQELQSARTSGLSNAQAQVDAQAASARLAQAQVTVESAAQNLALAEARSGPNHHPCPQRWANSANLRGTRGGDRHQQPHFGPGQYGADVRGGGGIRNRHQPGLRRSNRHHHQPQWGL
jgi:HlyD family secretion protein